MSIVHGYYTPADVMAIRSEMGTAYAVSDLQWGHFKDAEERKQKYVAHIIMCLKCMANFTFKLAYIIC